jgi:hypothetical protein
LKCIKDEEYYQDQEDSALYYQRLYNISEIPEGTGNREEIERQINEEMNP